MLGLSEAYRPNEENVDDYLAKTSLSPWVPLPDTACRAIIDLVQMNENDRHVDLGSGDGRVCFWIADGAKVEWTLGVDVDEGILDKARERLSKRHPLPKHIEFVQADLLKDQDHSVWDKIRQATVITMFFATPALRIFRPVLEEQLRGHSMKIVTAGYPMPGWNAWQTNVVLGTTLHYYRWGEEWEDEIDDDGTFLADDWILPETTRNALEADKFRGSKIIDRTSGGDPLKAAKLRMQQEEEEEDESWFDDDAEKEDQDSSDKPGKIAQDSMSSH
jgi:SAM-dependent methyltransferase